MPAWKRTILNKTELAFPIYSIGLGAFYDIGIWFLEIEKCTTIHVMFCKSALPVQNMVEYTQFAIAEL